ncbi:MAG TPA: hypothetical protein VNU93_03785 [Verrucomicrobiae bacterium]|nr:hypothetical protein [Verrucomicrobiae bacterium]
MLIGVDIDGVVSDSYPYWLGELNKHYNKQVKELYRYEMHLIFDVPWEDMNQFFVANVDRLFMIPQPMPGARRVLEFLRRKHEIHLVTARRREEEDVTREWLQKHHIPYDKLMVVGDRSKAEICREQGIELFIEDYAVNADMISKTGIPVIIFDAPYNRVELPQTVMRCHNWGQIYKYLENFR